MFSKKYFGWLPKPEKFVVIIQIAFTQKIEKSDVITHKINFFIGKIRLIVKKYFF